MLYKYYLVPPFKISVTSILKQKDLAIEKKKVWL